MKNFIILEPQIKEFLEVEATKMQLDVIDLIDALFAEVNPIPVKYALNLMGYNFGIPRLPLIELTDSNKEKMKEVMKKHKLI